MWSKYSSLLNGRFPGLGPRSGRQLATPNKPFLRRGTTCLPEAERHEGAQKPGIQTLHARLMVGPPGAGKSMLAARLPSILPPLSARELLDVSMIQSIAGELYKHGVNVQLSCEQGICGTCLTDVIEGLPDHRDLYQTEAEKAGNSQINICCSRARTPLLVLDI